MTVLFYRWMGITEVDALEVLIEMGVEVLAFEYPLKNYNEDQELEGKLAEVCRTHSFDCIFRLIIFRHYLW